MRTFFFLFPGNLRQMELLRSAFLLALATSILFCPKEGISAKSAVPSSPRNLAVFPGHSQTALTWEVPFSNGGVSITNYKIYRSTSAGTKTYLATVGNVLTYTDKELTNGTTYYYRVSAVNSVSEGPFSNEVRVDYYLTDFGFLYRYNFNNDVLMIAASDINDNTYLFDLDIKTKKVTNHVNVGGMNCFPFFCLNGFLYLSRNCDKYNWPDFQYMGSVNPPFNNYGNTYYSENGSKMFFFTATDTQRRFGYFSRYNDLTLEARRRYDSYRGLGCLYGDSGCCAADNSNVYWWSDNGGGIVKSDLSFANDVDLGLSKEICPYLIEKGKGFYGGPFNVSLYAENMDFSNKTCLGNIWSYNSEYLNIGLTNNYISFFTDSQTIRVLDWDYNFVKEIKLSDIHF